MVIAVRKDSVDDDQHGARVPEGKPHLANHAGQRVSYRWGQYCRGRFEAPIGAGLTIAPLKVRLVAYLAFSHMFQVRNQIVEFLVREWSRFGKVLMRDRGKWRRD